MAYTGIYVLTEAEIQSKEGAGVSADVAVAGTMHTQWVLETANYINVLCRKVWAVDATAFAALSADIRYLLSEYCSCIAAIYGISYDMSGYTSRIEAESMVNILWARSRRIEKLLKDQASVTFMNKS